MPDKAVMGEAPEQGYLAARYRTALEEELAQITDDSETSSEDRKPVTLDQQSVGRLSRMDALQGQAMAAALEVRRRGRKTRVVAALHRLNAGEFGYCTDCGGFIGLKRLDLDPTAARCTECAH